MSTFEEATGSAMPHYTDIPATGSSHFLGQILILTAFVAEAVASTHVSFWTQLFTFLGFVVTLFSSLPKLAESFRLCKRWWHKARES